MELATGTAVTARASETTRWGQLIFGIICMVMIANLQYGWTLFVNPIDQKYH
jgi:OFA family oxalate/formate antiporter-like MFS transporter